jgi:hypothetical protein
MVGGRAQRISLRTLYAVAVFATVAFSVVATTTPAYADEWHPFGTVLISGSAWLLPAGGGVDVYSNGTIKTVSKNYEAPAVGMKWQCVELAQRLYATHGWDPAGVGSLWGVNAVNIYGLAGFNSYPNNGTYTPVPGDMIVHSGNITGHVAITDSVTASKVYAVEQNVDRSAEISQGRATYSIGTDGTLTRDQVVKGLSIEGIVHSPLNMNTNGQMLLTSNGTAYAKGPIGLNGWNNETDPNVTTQIAISSTGLQMVLASDGEVWAKQDSTGSYGGWTLEAAAGTAKAIAVGGNTQMIITNNSTVYARSGIGNVWTKESDAGVGAKIAVSNTGLQMVLVTDGEVWAQPTIHLNGWTGEAPTGTATAIAVGGNTQMIVNSTGTVYARSGIGTVWNQETNVGVASTNPQNIAVSSTGVQMVLVNDGEVWAQPNITLNGWTGEVGSGGANAVSINDSGDQLILTNANAVYARTSIGTVWTQETGANSAVAISG